MSYFFLIMKRNLMILMCFASFFLCIFAVFTMKKALTIAQTPTLIAIDQNGTRLISRLDDPIFDTEAANFCREFVKKMYNFTPETFKDNVGAATELLSVRLWDEKQNSILQYKEQVEKNQISLDTKITKIIKASDSLFTVFLSSAETNRYNKIDRNLKLEIEIHRVSRSASNPFGLEVIRYAESQSL